jgi:hypothetical protein
MSTAERPGSLGAVPTLTEEVTLPPPLPEAAHEAVQRAPPSPTAEPAPPTAPVAPADNAPAVAVNEDQLVERILEDLQRQVDGVLEYRVREVLSPILARATDALVRDARNELTRTLRDVVARSVAQELLRRRSR